MFEYCCLHFPPTPNVLWEIFILKMYLLFILNSNLTWYSVFLFAKFGNPAYKGDSKSLPNTTVCTSRWWLLVVNGKHARKFQLPEEEKLHIKQEEDKCRINEFINIYFLNTCFALCWVLWGLHQELTMSFKLIPIVSHLTCMNWEPTMHWVQASILNYQMKKIVLELTR